jgi:hypothetical protein
MENTMSIVVSLDPQVAQTLHGNVRRSDLESVALELFNILDHYGVAIRPQHPYIENSELTSFFPG